VIQDSGTGGQHFALEEKPDAASPTLFHHDRRAGRRTMSTSNDTVVELGVLVIGGGFAGVHQLDGCAASVIR
jgi:hypothetical protein